MRRTDGTFPVWEIIPGKLYQCGETMYHRSPELKAKGLQHYGITHAVGFAPIKPDLDLVAWDEAMYIYYTHFPIVDGELKVGADLLLMAHELVEEIAAGGCVLTMCSAGRNRSGLLSALIVRELLCITGEEAIEHVRLQRPDALANDHFVEFLLQLP